MLRTRLVERMGGMRVQLGLCIVVSQVLGGGSPARAGNPPAKPDTVALGAEIFNREWMPNDPRGHGGDGLGPVFNDTSCVACHNSGGAGGAGPVSKNIDILSASSIAGMIAVPQPADPTTANGSIASSPPTARLAPLLDFHAGFRTSRTVVLHKFGVDPNYSTWRSQMLNQSLPLEVLPVAMPADVPAVFVPPGTAGTIAVPEPAAPSVIRRLPFRTGDLPATEPPPGFEPIPAPSLPPPQPVNIAISAPFAVEAVALPAAVGNADRGAQRIAEIQQMISAGQMIVRQPPQAVGEFLVAKSQRNPTPLFGLGLIDAIPDAVIETMASRQGQASQVQGRVSRLKDGRIGRLGWKGQTANAEDFVLNACAVEVGLEVPGHSQSTIPQAPRYKPPGLDLTAEECAALVAYVRSLPRPLERPASGGAEASFLDAGKAMFNGIGCTGCHARSLGDVDGIYSDLLLHDMGPEMADSGSYGVNSDDGTDEPLVPLLAGGDGGQPVPERPLRGATRQEWRTPPLWGFRDSGPYLHDGRAQTLEEAVALHGGQGSSSAVKFFELTPRERFQVEAFLKSLVAPSPVGLARAGG